ncbi:LOW QUALITY PROTEIN: uncharacterized protein LOC108899301 [Lates calcarifer]|uniref:LOW QUALITY PROTEIN: uncharacterized protein LOC108899301 n=1 Tax=Lates calcarifer TaxID=8187 RepID=A0AAJ8DQT1_LATCA|nr:LOW QUALITY PROTEIN: uncharacterized protein LOC108899301 [Lates calcarifer]
MGCSPSKGRLFSKPEGHGPQQDLLAESSQDSVDSRPVEEVSKCMKTDDDNELTLPTEEDPAKDTVWSPLAADTAAQNTVAIKEIGKNVKPQEIQRKSSIIQMKVDFPPNMVRAHQAAFAFLNPNISKYETLLGLLEQAAQTQLSLQPMMSALVIRFEEINQALEEMAEEGELMLKQHGDYMAFAIWDDGTSSNSPNPPPDLLQQLLQHSTEKMRLVGCSVQALGDSTLEEALEYFSSLSKLLAEKLQAKQAAEQRLAHVLAQVEGAAMRKSNPEDSALHSEDSGIGGENESLTGSERHRRHRGSAGSGSCGSGVNIRSALDSLPNNLPSLVGHNEDDEEDEDDDDDDDEFEDDEVDRPGRKRSNSSPPDPSQPLLYMNTNYMQDRQSYINGNEGGLVINGNNNNNSWPDSRVDLDVDNLPPPPPEVLMDNSFQSTDCITDNEEGLQEDLARRLPLISQKTRVSQRLRASVQNVEVLPSRTSMKPKLISILPAHPVRQDVVIGAQDTNQQPETDVDLEMEKANCQQACKIIHLCNESPDKRNTAELQARVGQGCESSEFCEGEVTLCSLPVTAPPVSRVRLPPSCPSVRHRFPSPPVFRSQSTSRASSRPSSPRTVTRATDNNTEEIIPSVSFRDARSVFCQNELQNTQTCISSGSSVLPRPWGEVSRGRLPRRGIDNSTRRTQSEQRPTLTSHSEVSKDSSSAPTQAKGSEPVSTNYRPGSPVMTGDNAHLDPSAAVTTA